MTETEKVTQTIKVKKWDILKITTTFIDQNNGKLEEFARVDHVHQQGESVHVDLSYMRKNDVPVTGGITVGGTTIDGTVLVPVVIEQEDWVSGRKRIETQTVEDKSLFKGKKFGHDDLSTLNRLHG